MSRRIYILADDDYLAVQLWFVLRGDGFIPYCPNINKFLGLQNLIPDLEEYNHDWLRLCDAVFQVPDTVDEGTIALAEQLGLPVYTDINDLERRGNLRVVSA